uniref:(northern house mosquito) hypothetical protein n=1 Tax=Culex pipiens TaxID=7175 RepID=A0A8D8K729_CULPI
MAKGDGSQGDDSAWPFDGWLPCGKLCSVLSRSCQAPDPSRPVGISREAQGCRTAEENPDVGSCNRNCLQTTQPAVDPSVLWTAGILAGGEDQTGHPEEVFRRRHKPRRHTKLHSSMQRTESNW